MTCSVLTTLCLLALIQAGSDGMNDSRQLIRQGRLSDAEERLEGLGELSDESAERSFS